jgi:LysR family transcriptional regulator, cys regulon transcriptional activator
MKLQQLKFLAEVDAQSLNISDAAKALFTSQPGVSKQIRQMEDELGLVIFERHGKRLTAVTPAGRLVIDAARRILREVDNLKRIGSDYANESAGLLTIATTHTQARYALPRAIKAFMASRPGIRLHVQQGSPTQVVDWLKDGVADIGIATEAIASEPELVALPCYQWSHLVVVPKDHPLLARGPLTLAVLAAHPIVTYDATIAGRSHIDRAFARNDMTANIVLTAIDSDVIKTYVELGLGVGIVAEMAFDPQRDTKLASLSASHLFEVNTTRVGFRRDMWLRGFDYEFLELLAPSLTRRVIQATLQGDGGDPGL